MWIVISRSDILSIDKGKKHRKSIPNRRRKQVALFLMAAMKRKNRAPSHISSALESLSISMGKREVYDFAAICGNWQDIVGRALAEVSSPARLARKSLTIEVAQPVWADSMGYMKNEIIEKVNA
ncbi:MAG: DUF721 domain-containing protein, partial [Nitrospinota bacterium]|nr:DUF721 domain-containing protein [Nitrospinota bacterium]